MIKTNFLVIGSNFRPQFCTASGKRQSHISYKEKIIDSSTNFAQGGIAAILDKRMMEQHVKDTRSRRISQ